MIAQLLSAKVSFSVYIRRDESGQVLRGSTPDDEAPTSLVPLFTERKICTINVSQADAAGLVSNNVYLACISEAIQTSPGSWFCLKRRDPSLRLGVRINKHTTARLS